MLKYSIVVNIDLLDSTTEVLLTTRTQGYIQLIQFEVTSSILFKKNFYAH